MATAQQPARCLRHAARSVRNVSHVSLASDNVFRDDGGIHQIATMSGSVASGYTAALTIGV